MAEIILEQPFKAVMQSNGIPNPYVVATKHFVG
jgi:hypothetical protein